MADLDSHERVQQEVALYRRYHAESIKCHPIASELLANFKVHKSTLLNHALKLTGRIQTILESLNSTHEVKLLSVQDFAPLRFESLVEEFRVAATQAERTTIVVKLHEAVVLESARPLDEMRAGLVALKEHVSGMADQCEFKELEIEHQGGIEEAFKRLYTYPEEELEVFKALQKRFRGLVHDGSELVFAPLDGDLELMRVLGLVRIKISEQPGLLNTTVPNPGERKEFYKAWQKVHKQVGHVLAKHAVREYHELRHGYEAAFDTAYKLAPEEYAYPDWCAVQSRAEENVEFWRAIGLSD
ncbi:hypothetical protein LTS10_002077 [Elasticomyces elasticus]|nr:hypothetical protein LTS10_002077 [Elasticomyces elasticus]